jgi:hypothetical protein
MGKDIERQVIAASVKGGFTEEAAQKRELNLLRRKDVVENLKREKELRKLWQAHLQERQHEKMKKCIDFKSFQKKVYNGTLPQNFLNSHLQIN